jgi:aerobic-type carbon monoxide dehydrogenase small subunit (CoxS/CutS family)
MVRFRLDGLDLEQRLPVWASVLDLIEAAGVPLPAGCRAGHCGSCTVLVAGTPAPACVVPAGAVRGTEVATARTAADENLVAAMAEAGAVQCGYCTPGIAVALSHALRAAPRMGPADVREVLVGHLCRCTGYGAIVAAAVTAASRARQRCDGGPAASGHQNCIQPQASPRDTPDPRPGHHDGRSGAAQPGAGRELPGSRDSGQSCVTYD